jgi:hypothetical protein
MDDLEVIVAIVVAVLFAVVVSAEVIIGSAPVFNQQDLTILVKEKIPMHDDKYLIIAEHDGIEEVFEVTDVTAMLFFDASDRYAYLKEGQTYNVRVGGWRYQFLSLYRDIYKIYGR